MNAIVFYIGVFSIFQLMKNSSISLPIRVKDIDFERNLIYVYDGKGGKSRTTVFPKTLGAELKIQIEKMASFKMCPK